MVNWNIIEHGFNTEDQTLNFGAREFGGETNLYESCTLATIKSDGTCDKNYNPRIIHHIKANKLFYAIDSSLGVFSDLHCSNVDLSIILEEICDVLCITKNAKYAFIGLRDGSFKLLNVEEKTLLIESKLLDNPEKQIIFLDCYLHTLTENQLVYFIVTTTGDIFRLEINNIQNDCEFKNDLLHQTHCDTKIVAFHYPYILLNGSKMIIYNIECDEFLIGMGFEAVKAVPYENSMFLILDTNGNLILICSKTLYFYKIATQTPFTNFVYIESQNENELLLQLLFISTSAEIGLNYLKSFGTILNLDDPSFVIKHAENIHLIVPESIRDDYIYVTSVKKDGVIVEFRVQIVKETVKEFRFKRLLKRHAFDEAEMFAKIFNLDRTLIVKGRAKALISKDNFNRETIQELFKLFDQVDDVEFKLICCYDMYELCTNGEDVRYVLEYGSDLVRKYQDNVEIETLSNTLMDVLNKFETFEFLQRYQNSMSWEKFSSCDSTKLYLEQLLMGNMEVASILLNRLDIKLSETNVTSVLNILDTIPSDFRQRFLYGFISITLRNLPSSIIVFNEWIIKKVFDMEKEERVKFPENAITFINEITTLLLNENEIFQSDLFQSSFNDIKMLLESLNRLKHLSRTYNICISLRKCLHDSKSLILTLLSSWLDKDDFIKFYDDFLCNFILENNLQPDDVLLEAIDLAMSYQKAVMEICVSSYLERINSIEKKLMAIYKVAFSANVPWSNFVRNVANSSLEYDHPITEQILELIEKEPKKSVLMKYNLHQYINLTSIFKVMFLINRILYVNKPTMIEDVLTLTITSKEKRLGNFMLFENLVHNWRTEDAYTFLDRIETEDWIPFCNSITNSIIVSSKNDFKSIKKFSSFIPIIKRKQKEKVPNYIYQKNLDNMFDMITGYFNTKEMYNEVVMNDLLDSRKTDELLNILIQNAFDEFKANDTDLDLLDFLINRTAKCVKPINKSKIFLKFLMRCNNLAVINKYANEYYYHVDDPKELFELGVVIIKKTNINENLICDVTFQDLTASCGPGNTQTLITNVGLAQKLFIKAMLYDRCSENQGVVNTYLLVKTFFGSITRNLHVNKQQEWFLLRNAIENVTPSTRTFYSVNDMLEIFVGCKGFLKAVNLKYLNHFCDSHEDLDEVNLHETLKKIHTTLKNLYMEGHVLAVYNILIFFLRNLDNSNQEMIDTLQTFIKQHCIPKLLENIFCANVIDYQFALTLLLSLNFNEFSTLIKNYIRIHKANPAKLFVIMQLTITVYRRNNVMHETYLKLLLLSKWWLKINGCKIQMKTFFVSSTKELLNLLFLYNHLSLDMLEEFCKDFNLNLQTSYVTYLEKLITNWKPDYEIIKETDGKLQLVLKSTENELFRKCEKVLNLITSTEMLPNYIEKFSSNINFYYYEAFMCVFKIISKLTNNTNFNKQQLLRFLNNYRRINKPGNLELEEWFAVFPVTGSIDELSNFRLPFSQMLFTEDVWNIIRPEINIKTYPTWFKAIPFLHKSLNVDDICTFVVKEVVSSGILSKEIDDNHWLLLAKHESLFKQIEDCVKNIVNIEKATSAINHLMIHTPNGADKVNAAFMCLRFANMYKKSTTHGSEGVDEAFRKIRNKYLKYSVCQILHSFKLNSDDYSKILLQPHDLIETLYIHKSIETANSTVVLATPDINAAVDKISALHNINILQKRKELLEAFLSTSAEEPKYSKDVIINLKRAAYICKSGELSFWQHHLAHLGTDDEVQLKLRAKANALKCLTMISDIETIETICSLEYNAFLNYIDKIYLLSDLEYRGFSMTIDQLNSYNKKILLRQLAQDIFYSNTIKIMADICIIYSMLDVKYWNKIIEVSIKLDMRDDLKHYIQFWAAMPLAKYKNFYINAWQYVIDNSFNECAILNKPDAFKYCIKTIVEIQSCPVLNFLNFEKVFKKLVQMDQFEFALVFTQYMADPIREHCLREVMSCTENVNISDLQTYGIYGINLVEDTLRNLY
nr:kinetochore-associated protein 1 [Onthophagus taurus]